MFKRYESREIVGKMPDRTGIEATDNQLAQQEKFRLAVLYGKAVMTDATAKAVYQGAAERKELSVFALTVADFLNAPAVDEVDLTHYSGKAAETIRIRASDDLPVQGVGVAIRDQGGAVLEHGAATWTAAEGAWVYTTTTTLTQGQSVSIEVTATDRPGHSTTKVQAHA